MNIDLMLRDALTDRAAQVPALGDSWQENCRRIAQARRRRTGAAGAATLILFAGIGLGFRPDPTATDHPDQLVPASRAPSTFTVDGVVVLGQPVKVGSVTYAGREHAVVAYLTRTPAGARPRQSHLWACTGVANDKGHVTPSMPSGACQGTNQPDASDFVLEVIPLGQQSQIPISSCRFGPLGNLNLVLTSARVTQVTLKVSDGTAAAMTLVPGTESWPYRLYSGEIPVNRFVAGYRLVGAQGVLQDPPPSEGRIVGCPTQGG